MTLRLSYVPISSNYASDLLEGMNIDIPLNGGPGRKRQDVQFPGHVVQCTWLLDPEEYPEFMGFFRTELKNSSQPFLVDLLTDIHVPTTHKCRTIGEEPKLIRQSGDGYWVQANLQAQANPTQTGFIPQLINDWTFDGIDDIALIGDVLHFQRTEPFSLSCWFRADSNNDNERLIANVHFGTSLTSARGYMLFNRTTAPTGLMFHFCSNSQSNLNGIKTYIPTASLDLIDGNEYHAVVTYSGNSLASGCKIYIDGVSQALTNLQNNLSATTVPDSGTNLTIGNSEPFGGAHDGTIRHVSIWSKELTGAEVTELFNAGEPGNLLAHSAVSDLELWLKFDNDDTTGTDGIVDRSGHGLDATAQNGLGDRIIAHEDSVLITYQNAFSSWFFDGINDTITMGDVHDKAAATAFSVSGWFATTRGGGSFANEVRLFAKRGASGNFSGWGVFMASSAGFLYWAFGGPDSSGARRAEIRTNNTFLDGEVHNFVCTKNTTTSSTGLKIYVDGVLQDTTTIFNTFAGSPLNSVSLAIDQNGLFEGILQHMAIWNKELSAAEALEIYNSGVPGDLLSTSMAANLEGWWKVDGSDTTASGGVTDHSANNNHGTAGGGLGASSGFHITYPNVAMDYLPGDFIRVIDSKGVHPTSDVDLNLDGIYEVDATNGFNNIRLVNPELTNTDWYKLYAINEEYGGVGNGDVTSTVTKVPT